jgi:hypothetical protein
MKQSIIEGTAHIEISLALGYTVYLLLTHKAVYE